MVVPFNEPSLEEDPGRERLLGLVRELCDRHGWKIGGHYRTPAVLSMLLEGSCERSTLFRLTNPVSQDGTRFDPFYREKSQAATGFIVMATIRALEEAGHAAGVATEAKDAYGTYDVVVVEGSPCLILKKGALAARVEIKASGSVSLLSQLTRYALSPAPLILARVVMNQVVVLEPSKLQEFTEFATEQLVARARRILDGRPAVVPGNYCRWCPDRACVYNEKSGVAGRRLIAMKEDELQDDLVRFYTYLPGVSKRVAREVVRCMGEAAA